MAEQSLGSGSEQVITPFDRGADSLLAGRQITRSLGKQGQPACHLGQEGFRGEDRGTGSCQFDGERQSVKVAAESCYGR